MVSSENKENKDDQVIGKLDKVADSLEMTSNQLSNVVTQQQLDLIRERVGAAESELVNLKSGYEVLAIRTSEHAGEAESGIEALADEQTALERDFAGIRALTITSFVLGVMCLIGLIVVSI